ncbi:MAG: TolC family protein [Nitrospirota bacterium]|jgi:outer membrane protein|nr:TolC family protein [Nitrospirota bacterium]MDH4361259.1 TolC family protein [Nitrospirota bacterium]
MVLQISKVLCLFVMFSGLCAGVNMVTWAAPLEPSTARDLPELRLSLREAMDAAVDQNPTVRLFIERIAQARDVADTQLGELLPNLSGTAGYSRRRFFTSSFGGGAMVTNPRDFYEMRAFLTQNVFSLSLIQKWRAAKAGVDVAGLDAEVTKRDTMATTGLVYLEALRAIAAVDARTADVVLNKELLRLATERKSAGMATSLDVTRAKVQLENAKQRLLVAENARDRSKLNLIRSMGLSFDVRLVLTDEMKLVEVSEQSVGEALQVAKENRTELKAQKNRERLASLTLSSVTNERVPSIKAAGDVGMIGNQIPNALTTDNVQVLMTVPIFDGGQREGRISESRSKVRQEEIKTQDVQYQVALEVRDALITMSSAKEQVAVAEEGLKLALTELELSRERFAVGVATNIEVTDAQTRVAQARDNLIEGLFTFNASRLGLARAQGQLEKL